MKHLRIIYASAGIAASNFSSETYLLIVVLVFFILPRCVSWNVMFVALKIRVSVISKYLSMSTRELMESLSVQFTTTYWLEIFYLSQWNYTATY